jgi:hypothetical protein
MAEGQGVWATWRVQQWLLVGLLLAPGDSWGRDAVRVNEQLTPPKYMVWGAPPWCR